MEIPQEWEDIDLIIDSASFDTQEPHIDVTVNDEYDGSSGRYRVLITRHRRNRLYLKTFTGYPHVKKDHPLLWDYNDLQAGLYFSGETDEVYKLIWELMQISMSLYDSYLPPSYYLNAEKQMNKLLAAKAGLLASGPKTLLLKYAACLEQYGFRYTIINERKPEYWDGEKRVEEQRTAQVLLMGDSYIIADKFDLVKL